MLLPEAIRNIRKRLNKNQTEFAAVLGCRPNSVSRYESGKVTPGPAVLYRLWDLALGAEREAVGEKLKQVLGQQVSGESEVIIDLEPDSLRAAFSVDIAVEMVLNAVPKRKRGPLRPFLLAAIRTAVEVRSVDDSLTEILNVWLQNAHSPKARGLFRDAAAYLRVRFAGADAPPSLRVRRILV